MADRTKWHVHVRREAGTEEWRVDIYDGRNSWRSTWYCGPKKVAGDRARRLRKQFREGSEPK